MKKIFFTLPVTILLLASCGTTPESVTKDFYTALKEKNTAKLEALSTSESHSQLEMAQQGASFIIGKGNVTKIECIEIDNEQECDCWFEGKKEPISTVLAKENDTWKVDVNSTFKKVAGNGILDLLKGNSSVGGLLDALSGEGNLNKIVEEFSKQVSDGSLEVNKILEGIDPDDLAKSINGMDTSLTKTFKLLEEKGIDVEKALMELQKTQE